MNFVCWLLTLAFGSSASSSVNPDGAYCTGCGEIQCSTMGKVIRWYLVLSQCNGALAAAVPSDACRLDWRPTEAVEEPVGTDSVTLEEPVSSGSRPMTCLHFLHRGLQVPVLLQSCPSSSLFVSAGGV